MLVATGILAKTLLRLSGVRSPYFQDPYTSSHSPIIILISWIYHLPIEHRKALLDACRIQAPVWVNNTLSATFASLRPVDIHSVDGLLIHQLSANDLAFQFEQIWSFPILCSLLSYFVRAEGTIYKEEFLRQKDISLDKELQAALYYETNEQKLTYTGLLGVDRSHLHPQLHGMINWRLTSLFQAGVRHIAQRFSSTSTRPLFPAYNARKNVSYSTCRNYYDAIGNSMAEEYSYNVTTLDLLKLYYKTGIETLGHIEVRQAWFFNDLKPRTYYCLGGTDFFHGMFIQEIANLFCNMLPSTNPFSRFTVSRIGSLTYDELLITYDYSSFTTSLGELQHFMFWLAESVGDVVIQVLDVFHGVKDYSLRHILHAYNQSINQHQMFSIERFQEAEEAILLRQGRSGSLGVKGNIVFSTTLHGLALADITGTPDDDCCVGDDALAKIRAYFLVIFIQCVNNLGDINPQKFTTITPHDNLTERPILSEQYKFLKRPLNIDFDTKVPVLGRLDFFPSIADALCPEGDGVHTATPGYSHYNSARTFAMQVGRFYRQHCAGDFAPIITREEDLWVILHGFEEVYKVYGLPCEGGIPGDFVVRWGGDNSRTGLFYCPPVDSVWVFDTPWMDILLDRFYGRSVSTPVTCGGTIPPPLDAALGQRFRATSDVKVLQLGVDLGFLEKTVETTFEFFDQDVSDRIWAKMVEGGKDIDPILASYEVVEPLPSWWFDIVSYEYPDTLEEDPLDTAERLSSIMSGSII
jgi:hypothetical protein